MKSLTWDDIDRLSMEDAVRYFEEVDREIKERKLERQNTRSETSDNL